MNLERKKTVTKLLDEGFEFLRKEDSTNSKNGTKYIIKVCRRFGAWQKLGEYSTKAKRDAAFVDLIDSGDKYLG